MEEGPKAVTRAEPPRIRRVDQHSFQLISLCYGNQSISEVRNLCVAVNDAFRSFHNF